MAPFPMWLTVALVAAAALLVLLAVVSLTSEMRRLRAGSAPRPWLVIWQRIRSLMPIRGRSGEELAALRGRQVWLAWDLRWVTAGETLADVTASDPASRGLHLRLGRPIVLEATAGAPAVRIELAEFTPRDAERARYGRAAVRGTLRPTIPGGLVATAQVVVYPREASNIRLNPTGGPGVVRVSGGSRPPAGQPGR
jgi:hypothetical protein